MSAIWEKFIRAAMFSLDAERAHEIAVKALQVGAASPFYSGNIEFEFGELERFGLKFRSPLGIAAGFDKNGTVTGPLCSLGFGFVEVGTVTLRPQKGNERPRLFRLPQDLALINRLGFNNDGAQAVAERLVKLRTKCVIGVNIGKNRDTPNEEAVADYLKTLEIVHPVADYIAVNVSSPNTPGLRELQKAETLRELLAPLQEKNQALGRKPLLLKISPDLADDEIEMIAYVSMANGIDGLIATNTTVSRDGLRTKNVKRLGDGGLSGSPLTIRSNAVISAIFKSSNGKLPIIGVGGIMTAEDAFNKITSGASLIQAYTGFVYGGPRFPIDIQSGLADILNRNGFSTLDDAIGTAVS